MREDKVNYPAALPWGSLFVERVMPHCGGKES